MNSNAQVSETSTEKPKRKGNGGSAFPRTGYAHPSASLEIAERTDLMNEPQAGMTLRDYFAASAMTGLLHVGADPDAAPWVLAEHAYLFADAMLAERSK